MMFYPVLYVTIAELKRAVTDAIALEAPVPPAPVNCINRDAKHLCQLCGRDKPVTSALHLGFPFLVWLLS
jgi:hypothetical protein